MDQSAPDRTAVVDHCEHTWGPLVNGERRCLGSCGVVLRGSLAEDPQATGVDWTRAVLVVPTGRMSR